MTRPATQTVVCQGCVLMMIRRCYRAHWWFRLVREPLVAGMRLLALVNGIRPKDYAAKNPECHGCLRFIKAELEIRSATFRFLNGLIGRKFRTLRDSMLEEKDFAEARQHAAEMMALLEAGDDLSLYIANHQICNHLRLQTPVCNDPDDRLQQNRLAAEHCPIRAAENEADQIDGKDFPQ